MSHQCYKETDDMCFLNVAFERVPVFVCITRAVNRPFKSNYRNHCLFLCLSLSSRWSMVWCPLLCTRKCYLQLFNTSALLRRKTLVTGALPAFSSVISLDFNMSLGSRSTEAVHLHMSRTADPQKFLTSMCPEQQVHRSV